MLLTASSFPSTPPPPPPTHTAGGRCTTGVQLALAAEKADTDKVEEKRSQLAPATEEEKEEGEITSDDESENIREGGHTEQEGVLGPLDCN